MKKALLLIFMVLLFAPSGHCEDSHAGLESACAADCCQCRAGVELKAKKADPAPGFGELMILKQDVVHLDPFVRGIDQPPEY